MADRASGQRLALRIPGGVSADVSLVKASRALVDARPDSWEALPPDVEPAPAGVDAAGDPFGGGEPEALADRIAAQAVGATPPVEGSAVLGGLQEPSRYAVIAETGESVKLERRQGVIRESGERVDLTAELAAIDDRTRVDGLEVLFTVDAQSVPRFRVRDAHYVVPAGRGAGATLAHVAHALRAGQLASVVRWTKRTNQALGVVVPFGRAGRVVLALLEVEWAACVRDAPDGAVLPLDQVGEAGAARAGELFGALRRPAAALDDVVDERVAQRQVLLASARAGKAVLVEPERSVVPDEAAAFAAALEGVA